MTFILFLFSSVVGLWVLLNFTPCNTDKNSHFDWSIFNSFKNVSRYLLIEKYDQASWSAWGWWRGLHLGGWSGCAKSSSKVVGHGLGFTLVRGLVRSCMLTWGMHGIQRKKHIGDWSKIICLPFSLGVWVTGTPQCWKDLFWNSSGYPSWIWWVHRP